MCLSETRCLQTRPGEGGSPLITATPGEQELSFQPARGQGAIYFSPRRVSGAGWGDPSILDGSGKLANAPAIVQDISGEKSGGSGGSPSFT